MVLNRQHIQYFELLLKFSFRDLNLFLFLHKLKALNQVYLLLLQV